MTGSAIRSVTVHVDNRARAVNAPGGDAGAETDRLALVVVNFAASGLIAANLADAALHGRRRTTS